MEIKIVHAQYDGDMQTRMDLALSAYKDLQTAVDGFIGKLDMWLPSHLNTGGKSYLWEAVGELEHRRRPNTGILRQPILHVGVCGMSCAVCSRV